MEEVMADILTEVMQSVILNNLFIMQENSDIMIKMGRKDIYIVTVLR